MGWAQRTNEKAALKKAGVLEPKPKKSINRYRELKQIRLAEIIEKSKRRGG